MTLTGTGSLLGLLAGLAHAAYVYRVVASEGDTRSSSQPGTALYYALWTVSLWVLFGSYLLLLWLLGGLLYLAARWRH